ncbi:PaaI family thioesterase [Bradyrhizobium sp. B097]|uniref:PaaI family thioesterase n=1 Tax=Bradyrhizobium sp. B097 TaxID=3140244 RepID=UPI003182C725
MTEFDQLARGMFKRATSDDSQEYGNFFLSRLLGFEFEFGSGLCSVCFEASRLLQNPQGSLHGGILALAMDMSMGHRIHHVAGVAATVELKVQYFAPITSGIVRCEASFLSRGRKISLLESRALRADRVLVAHATATWKQRTQIDVFAPHPKF